MNAGITSLGASVPVTEATNTTLLVVVPKVYCLILPVHPAFVAAVVQVASVAEGIMIKSDVLGTLANTVAPNVGTVVYSKLISVRAVHPLNALAPILVTYLVINAKVSLVQPWKALAPIVVIDCGTIIPPNDVQPWNALVPIVVKTGNK